MIPFSGGLKLKLNPLLPSQGGFHSLSGFHFSEDGSLTKWNGFSRSVFGQSMDQILESSVPGEITGAFHFVRRVGSAQLIVCTRNSIYLKSGASWTNLKNFSVPLPAGSQVDFVLQNEVVYIVAAGTENYLWDGTTIYDNGANPPSVLPAAVISSSGVLTGGYSYKYTYMNLLGNETNSSPASATVTASLSSISVTPTASIQAQVTAIRLYRTTSSGGVWLFLSDLPNSSTPFIDNIPDSLLGIAVEEFANGRPPASSIIEQYAGIVFYAKAGSTILSFSGEGRPSSVDTEIGSLDLVSSDAEQASTITGMKELGDRLAVFKNESIWNVVVGGGEVRADIQVPSVGSVNNAGIVSVPGSQSVAFPSKDGFYLYDGLSEKYISASIEPLYRTGLNQSRLAYMVGITYKRLNMILWFASSALSSFNDIAIVYDYVNELWSTRPIPNLASTAVTLYDSALVESFVIGGYDGYLRTGDTGLSDDGKVMPCEVIPLINDTGTFSETIKSFYSMGLFFEQNAGVTLECAVALDDPKNTYFPIGTINAQSAARFARIKFNLQGRRAYLRIRNNQIGAPLILRGHEMKSVDTGRVSP